MILVKQPKGSARCGPCVVAMLCDKNLDDISMSDGPTLIGSLIKQLENNNVSIISNRFVKHENELTTNPGAILIDVKNLVTNQNFKHWIAWDGNQVFDPKFGIRQTLNRTTHEIIENAIFFEAK